MKTTEHWVLFEDKHGKLVLLSKLLKTKKAAEKAREKYPDGERNKVGVGRSL